MGPFVRKWVRGGRFLDFDPQAVLCTLQNDLSENPEAYQYAGWVVPAKLETEDPWINRRRLSLHMPKPAHSNPDLSRI